MLLYITLLIISVVYIQTMMPSQAFHDSGELQTVVSTLSVAHPTGFPTYIILSKILTMLIPIGEMAWKVNFLSVVYSTSTLFLLALFLFKLTKNSLWPIIGILYLAFIFPFWNWAGMADTNSLNRLFLALSILLFLNLSKNWNRKNLFIFALTFGLGLGNHLILIYSIPGFLVWYLMLVLRKNIQLDIYQLALGLLYFSLGLSAYLFLPLSEYFNAPIFLSYSVLSWGGFFRHVSGADFQGLMYQGGLPTIFNNSIMGLYKIGEYFGLSGVLVGLLGIIYGLYRYQIVISSLIVMFLSFLIFSTNYPTSDPTRYYLTYITVYSLFISIGSYSIFICSKKMLNFRKEINKLILAAVFILLCLTPIMIIWKNYVVLDKSKDFHAENYSRNIFQNLEPNSVIISWWNYTTPLWYRQYVLNERPDINIINVGQSEWRRYVDQNIKTRPVYLVENEREVGENYKVVQYGYVYKIFPK